MLDSLTQVRRWISIGVFGALLLAACGGTAPTTNPSGGTTPVASTPVSAATTVAATPAPAQTPMEAATPTAATTSQTDATLTMALTTDPPSLDPAFSTTFVDRQVHNSLYDKLFDLNENGEVIPMLVKEWEVSDDQLTYTFMLQEGVMFHDGTPLDAEAVKFTLERNKNDEKSARRNELKLLNTIEVVDATTIKIGLSEPYAPLLSVLTDRSGMIVSPTAAAAAGEDFRNKPVGSGPFKFQGRVAGDNVTLVRNEEYWREGLPKVAQVVYRIFPDINTQMLNLRSGQIDIADAVLVDELQNEGGITIINEPSFAYQGFWLNINKPPLDNKFVRQAIDLMIDRDVLIQPATGGAPTWAPAHSPFSESMFAHGETDIAPKPDVEKAKALLAQSGLSDISFTLAVGGTSPGLVRTGELIQGFLQPIGIQVQIEKGEFAAMLDQLNKGNFEAAVIGWSGRPDPDQNIYDAFSTGGSLNYAKYSNPELDALLQAARKEGDQEKRKELYQEAVRILHDDVPYVFTFHNNVVFGMSNKVGGYVFIPDGIIRTAALEKMP